MIAGFCPIGLYAQLDNSAFYEDFPVDSTQENVLSMRFHNHNFTKNNEYFNYIADGYTLFGTQFSPRMSYQPTKYIRIDAGVYLWKDFGNSKFSQVAPLFTFQYHKNKTRLIMGNLQGNLNHRYIEPLYDFEWVMVNRLENGLQYINSGKRYFFDAWINWQRMLYEYEVAQEQVTGGISSYYNIVDKEKFLVQIPFQTVITHKGGQIDFSPLPLLSYINTASGVSAEYKFGEHKFLRSVRSDNYFVHFYDFSRGTPQPYLSGNGLYANLTFDTKIQKVMLSYWQGNKFMSIQGGQLYPSVSSHTHHPGYLEPNRSLFIIRFMQDIKLYNNIFLTMRFEPFFDLNKGTFEFSHGLYINYKETIRLTKIKKVVD